eukprot:2232088-Pyramimonas_sp.AAC.1
MLRRIWGTLHPDDCADDAALCLCVIIAFFFTMRIGEYAHSSHWPPARQEEAGRQPDPRARRRG